MRSWSLHAFLGARFSRASFICRTLSTAGTGSTGHKLQERGPPIQEGTLHVEITFRRCFGFSSSFLCFPFFVFRSCRGDLILALLSTPQHNAVQKFRAVTSDCHPSAERILRRDRHESAVSLPALGIVADLRVLHLKQGVADVQADGADAQEAGDGEDLRTDHETRPVTR